MPTRAELKQELHDKQTIILDLMTKRRLILSGLRSEFTPEQLQEMIRALGGQCQILQDKIDGKVRY